MIRTQVYLPEELHRHLLLIANQEKVSLTELIRKGAKKLIKERNKKYHASQFLKNITGIVKGGPADLSQRVDYYLYDQPYENKKRKR